MRPSLILLCNGVDDSLTGLELGRFRFTTISANDPKPIKERTVAFTYKSSSESDGSKPSFRRDPMLVDSLYDLIQHLFAPYSSVNSEYLTPVKYWEGNRFEYHGLERYSCFVSDDNNDWYNEMICLLDSVRLFKLTSFGIGLCIDIDDSSIGLNDRYKFETDVCLWKYLPTFSLSDEEEQEFIQFYKFYHKWFFDPNPGSKDTLLKSLLSLFRTAYHVSDIETSLLIQSEIWELYTQIFPRRKETKTDKFNKNKNKKEKKQDKISYLIEYYTSLTIRNTEETRDKVPENIFKIVKYLYSQRGIIVHQDSDNPFDFDCITVAFDISRCLILKLLYAQERETNDIITKLDACKPEDIPYKNDNVRLNPIDKKLLKRIFKPT